MSTKTKILYLFKEHREVGKTNMKLYDENKELKRKLEIEKKVFENLKCNYEQYKQIEIDNLNKEIKQLKSDYMKISEKYQQLIDKYINLQKRKIK